MSIKLNMDILASAGSVFTTLKGISTSIEGLSKKGASDFDKLAAAGKGIAIAIGGTAVAVGAKTVKMAADFQTGVTTLQTGAGESASNMKLVSNGILDMAGQVGQSTSTLVDGMYHIESAGFHGAAGLNVLKTAAEGAKVGNADLDTMGKTLVGTMNSYGMAGDKASVMMNQLIATTASGDMKMQDLAASLGNVTPVAAAAGINFAQVGGAIATMTSQNMSAQQATQDLSFLIRGLQNPTAVATKEMAAMGLNSTTVAQDLGKRGLTGTLDELTSAITAHMGPSGLVLQNAFNQSKTAAADANTMLKNLPASLQSVAKEYLNGSITQKQWTADIKGMSPEIANQAKQFATVVKHATGFNDILRAGGPAAQTYTAALSEMTGGATGLNASLMLTGANASVFAGNVKTVGDAAANTSGTVTGWDLVQKTFNQKLAEAKGHAEALGIKIGMALIPKIEAVTSALMKVVDWLGRHKAIAEALAVVIGGILSVAMGAYFLKLGKGLIESAAEMGKFALASGKAMVAAGKAVAEFAVEMASMAAEAATAFLEMAAEALTWAGEMAIAGAEALLPFLPIIAAVAAVGAAAYLLYTYWDQIWGFIKEVVSDAFGWIRDHIKLIIAVLLGPFGLAIDAVWTHWKAIWGFIKDVAKEAWNFLYKDVFRPIIEIAIWPLEEAIKILLDLWKLQWDGIRDAAKAAWNFLDNDVFKPLVRLGTALIRGEIDWTKRAWETAWNAIMGPAKAAWDFLRDDVFNPIVNVGLAGIRGALDLLKSGWDIVWNGIKDTVNTIWGIIKPIFDMISNAVGGIQSALGGVQSAAGSVGNFVGGVGNSIGSFFGFADGGPVPGPKGTPMLAIVHGGEYVLSNDMLSGRSSIGGGSGPAVGTAPIIQIFPQGSLLTQADFFSQMQEAFLQNGGRFSSTYTSYAH